VATWHDSSLREDLSRGALYVEADFAVDTTRDIHELNIAELARIVTRVVGIEGPVHQDEVARRVATLWGLKRTGVRITTAVERALAEAVYRNRIEQSGLFFRLANRAAVPIRSRESVASANLRKPDFLPPAEIREALAATVRVHLGMMIDEAATEVARLFGFRTTSLQLKQIILDEVRFLLEAGVLEQRSENLYLSDAALAALPV
jgi:hypothetical protein